MPPRGLGERPSDGVPERAEEADLGDGAGAVELRRVAAVAADDSAALVVDARDPEPLAGGHHDGVDGGELRHPALVERVEEHLVVAHAVALRLLDAADQERRPEDGDGGVVVAEHPAPEPAVGAAVDEVRLVRRGEQAHERLRLVARQRVADEGHVAVAEPAEEVGGGEVRQVAPPRLPPPVDVPGVRAPVQRAAPAVVLDGAAGRAVVERRACVRHPLAVGVVARWRWRCSGSTDDPR